jgi:hypothetical protein
VITLCWGIDELLRELVKDKGQAAKAGKTAQRLLNGWCGCTGSS